MEQKTKKIIMIAIVFFVVLIVSFVSFKIYQVFLQEKMMNEQEKINQKKQGEIEQLNLPLGDASIDTLPIGPAGTKDGKYHPITPEDIEYLEKNKNNQ